LADGFGVAVGSGTGLPQETIKNKTYNWSIMICLGCGKEIDDNSKFCSECGKDYPHTKKTNNFIPKIKPPIPRNWLVILTIIIVLVAILQAIIKFIYVGF